MQAIITEAQQTALIKNQAIKRLTREQLAKTLGLSRPTTKNVLDGKTPLIVSGKTFTAVNNWLINQLDN